MALGAIGTIAASIFAGAEGTIGFLQTSTDYFPAPWSWVLFFVCAATAAYAIAGITPLGRVRRVARTDAAPRWNRLVGLTFFLVGIILAFVGLTWIWASSWLESFLGGIEPLMGLLSITSLTDILTAGPYVTLVLGLVIALCGIGVLRWVDPARRAALVTALALFIGSTILAPFLILLPSPTGVQTLGSFVIMEALIIFPALAIRVLLMPEIRLRYQE